MLTWSMLTLVCMHTSWTACGRSQNRLILVHVGRAWLKWHLSWGTSNARLSDFCLQIDILTTADLTRNLILRVDAFERCCMLPQLLYESESTSTSIKMHVPSENGPISWAILPFEVVQWTAIPSLLRKFGWKLTAKAHHRRQHLRSCTSHLQSTRWAYFRPQWHAMNSYTVSECQKSTILRT